MSLATLWVIIDLLHQLAHAVFAISNNLGRIAPCSSNQLVSDYQHAVILARNKTLDQHVTADFCRYRISRLHLFAACQIHTYTLSLVPIPWLDNDRAADFTGGDPCILCICYGSTHRDRNASCIEQH